MFVFVQNHPRYPIALRQWGQKYFGIDDFSLPFCIVFPCADVPRAGAQLQKLLLGCPWFFVAPDLQWPIKDLAVRYGAATIIGVATAIDRRIHHAAGASTLRQGLHQHAVPNTKAVGPILSNGGDWAIRTRTNGVKIRHFSETQRVPRLS